MSADALSSDQFSFTKSGPHDLVSNHKLQHEGGAALRWHRESGRVMDITVPEDQRRKGVATGLWHEAHRIASETRGVTPPKHSEDRTNEGDAWARSVSKRVPKRVN